jgi:hypothetical protein
MTLLGSDAVFSARMLGRKTIAGRPRRVEGAPPRAAGGGSRFGCATVSVLSMVRVENEKAPTVR